MKKYSELDSIKVNMGARDDDEDGDHPLMSLILTLTFPYVSGLDDLKSIRLVSRLWRDVSLPQWRTTGVIRLSREKDCSHFCHGCHRVIDQVDYGRTTLSLEKYLQLVQKSEEDGDGHSCPTKLGVIPFTRYRIGYCNLTRRSLWEEHNVMKDFWRVCGPHIQFLYLDHCSTSDTRFGKAFRKIDLGKCVKLKELWLHLVPTEVDWEFGLTSRQLDELNGTDGLGPALKLETMRLSICRKRRREPREFRLQQFTPLKDQWKVLLQLAPNLKNLRVDTESCNAIKALQSPTITGQHIKLSQLSYSLSDNSPKEDLRILPPGVTEYMDIARPPLRSVEMRLEQANWNLSYFRETVSARLQPVVRNLRIFLSTFCYSYVFLHFLKVFLEYLVPPQERSSSSGGSGGGDCGFGKRMMRKGMRCGKWD